MIFEDGRNLLGTKKNFWKLLKNFIEFLSEK